MRTLELAEQVSPVEFRIRRGLRELRIHILECGGRLDGCRVYVLDLKQPDDILGLPACRPYIMVEVR